MNDMTNGMNHLSQNVNHHDRTRRAIYHSLKEAHEHYYKKKKGKSNKGK